MADVKTRNPIKKEGTQFPGGPLLTHIDELQQTSVEKEKVRQIKGAKPLFVDHELLQHDFPEISLSRLEHDHPALKKLKGAVKDAAVKEKIESWLLDRTAYISENQASQEMVNTPIGTNAKTTLAYRPPQYGRALIFPTKPLRRQRSNGQPEHTHGLLDVKGVGLAPGKIPGYFDHSNGLLFLKEAFIEYLNQRLIQAIFRHSRTQFETVPVYAIIDPGFDIKFEDRNAGPGAFLVRRAHIRPENPGGLPVYQSAQQNVQLEIELLLRKYGLTSTNYVTTYKLWKEDGQIKITYGGKPIGNLNEAQIKNIEEVSHIREETVYFEGINIQHTRAVRQNPSYAQLVDFGSFRARQKFEHPILSLVSDKLLRWGGSIWPDFEVFPQPDPRYCVPFEQWGNTTEFWGYPARLHDTKQDILCEGLATDYRQGKLSGTQVMSLLNAFLQTATSRLTA